MFSAMASHGGDGKKPKGSGPRIPAAPVAPRRALPPRPSRPRIRAIQRTANAPVPPARAPSVRPDVADTLPQTVRDAEDSDDFITTAVFNRALVSEHTAVMPNAPVRPAPKPQLDEAPITERMPTAPAPHGRSAPAAPVTPPLELQSLEPQAGLYDSPRPLSPSTPLARTPIAFPAHFTPAPPNVRLLTSEAVAAHAPTVSILAQAMALLMFAVPLGMAITALAMLATRAQ